MRRLVAWLSNEPNSLKERFDLILAFSVVGFLWTNVAVYAITYLGLLPYIARPVSEPGIKLDLIGSIQFLIGAAIFEEILFRLIPLKLASKLGSGNAVAIFSAAVASSAVFGYMHGGWVHLSMQGIVGLMFCAVYLKYGGMQGKILLPTAASSTTHFFVNL